MKKNIILSMCLSFFLSSCYEDYKDDFANTAAYFSYQYPVRTLKIDRDASTLKFKVGAVIGGKYSYEDSHESVYFSIVDSLVTKNKDCIDKGIKLMPSDWYTLSDNAKIEMNGSNGGMVEVSIDRDKFIANVDGATNTYAIPFLLTETTCDSILEGKDFSIVVVKYMNEFDGRYYVKGRDDVLNLDGSVASSETYSNEALVLNKYVFLETIGQDVVEITRIGANEKNRDFVYNMTIRPTDGAALLSLGEGSKVSTLVGSASYNQAERTFVSEYNYTLDGVEHNVNDTLIFYNEVMTLEEWQ